MRLIVLPILALSLVAVGCGEKAPTKQAEPGKSETSLTVTKPDGSKTTITCPGADERCPKITPEALKPIPVDAVCGQVYGGPEKARIVGMVNGERVNLSLSRTDSCRIAQWDSLTWLVGVGPVPNQPDQLNSPELNKPAKPSDRPEDAPTGPSSQPVPESQQPR